MPFSSFHEKLEWLKTNDYKDDNNYWTIYDEVKDSLSKSLKEGPVTSELCSPDDFDPYVTYIEVVVKVESRFYRFSYCLQSWSEMGGFEDCDLIGDITEVVPVEKVVTVYEPRT